MQEMNNNNILTGFVKQLLREFNLPKASVLRKGMRIFEDSYYIYGSDIYVCTATQEQPFDGDMKSLKKISAYVYGEKYLNITKTLSSDTQIYDAYTHEYLGDYLRFYRDYKDINLMSMYNCFGNDTANNVDISLTVNGKTVHFDTSDSAYVIYAVPIRWFNEYTIGVDCSANIELMACIYDGNGIVSFDNESALYSQTYVKSAGNRFSKPFKYDKLKNFSVSKRLKNNERHLVLLMKVPASCKSSIVVLEGDWLACSEYSLDADGQSVCWEIHNYAPSSSNVAYRYNSTDNKYEELNANSGTTSEYKRKYASKNQLLMVNDGAAHPFSDKLIGYLLFNVITSDDGISDNIRRLQKALIHRGDVGYNYSRNPGSWEPNLRDYIYDLGKSLQIADNSFDFIGFVDRDIEKALGADINHDSGQHSISGGTR